MTTHSSAHARRHRMRRPAAASAVVSGAPAVLVVLAVILGMIAAPLLGPAGAAAAATASPSPATLGLTVAAASAGVITPGQPVSIAVAVQNPTDANAPAAAVRVSASARPLSTRAELDAWLGSAAADASRTELSIGTGDLGAIAAQGTAGTTLTVDAAALAALSPGVYPLRAEYAAATGSLTAASVLVVPAAAASGGVGVIVPITAPPMTSGLPGQKDLGTLTAPGGTLRQLLDAVTGTEAILAVDPSVVAAIRVLGSRAPESATQWLADLTALPNPRFALQFGDADVAVQVAAGLPAPLTVPSLASYLSADGFPRATPEASPAQSPANGGSDAPASPTPGATPGTAPALPTLAELTDVGASSTTVYWPQTGRAGADTVAALAASASTPPVTIVGSDRRTDDAAASPAWATVGGAAVLVTEASTSRELTTAATTDVALTRASSLAAASAYASLASAAAPDAPLLVALDRAVASSPAGVRAAISTAAHLAGRATIDLTSLRAGAPTALSLRPAEVAPERVADLSSLLSDESSLTEFATILSDPAVLTEPERAAVLQLISAGWPPSTTAGAEAVQSHRAQTRETLASVAIVPPSDITFAATSAPLSFSVRNDLRWPVTVQLVATVADPRMIVQNLTTVDAGAAQITRVSVPVEARVASGESTLRLQLRTPVGGAIGENVPVHVAVRAEWESVGLVVMSVLVGGMIVIGAIRTVRKIRRRRRERSEPQKDADG